MFGLRKSVYQIKNGHLRGILYYTTVVFMHSFGVTSELILFRPWLYRPASQVQKREVGCASDTD